MVRGLIILAAIALTLREKAADERLQMFLDVLRRRNPRLIEQAIALHQAGRIPANSYVIDLDAVEANARTHARRSRPARAQDLRHDQADGPQRLVLRGAFARGGIDKAVAVDMECARACARGRPGASAISAIWCRSRGPRPMPPRRSTPDYWTVFNVEKAAEAAAAP